MKKIMIVVIAALILFPAGLKAQNTEKAIAKIRKDYATALEKIKASGDFYDYVFVNCATIHIHEMWGGSGPHQENTMFPSGSFIQKSSTMKTASRNSTITRPLDMTAILLSGAFTGRTAN